MGRAFSCECRANEVIVARAILSGTYSRAVISSKSASDIRLCQKGERRRTPRVATENDQACSFLKDYSGVIKKKKKKERKLLRANYVPRKFDIFLQFLHEIIVASAASIN